jgi:hypothetical protein
MAINDLHVCRDIGDAREPLALPGLEQRLRIGAAETFDHDATI